MSNFKSFSGENEQQIWHDITADLNQHGEIFNYAAEIHQQGRIISFEIEMDLGGGFEGGFTSTRFISSVVSNYPEFRFSIHDQHWTDQIGKLFGMEDIQIGNIALDEALIIKTNKPEILRPILSNPIVAQTLLNYGNFKFELKDSATTTHAETTLQFTLEEALTNPEYLREIYHLLWEVTNQLALPTPA